MASGRKAPHGVVLRIVATTICDSDLHVYRGSFPVPKGMATGHEMTGEVIEAGPDVEFLAEGDLVSVPFNVACGRCRARWRPVPSPARPCTSPARAQSAAAAARLLGASCSIVGDYYQDRAADRPDRGHPRRAHGRIRGPRDRCQAQEMNPAYAINQVIDATRTGGAIGVIGVYGPDPLAKSKAEQEGALPATGRLAAATDRGIGSGESELSVFRAARHRL